MLFQGYSRPTLAFLFRDNAKSILLALTLFVLGTGMLFADQLGLEQPNAAKIADLGAKLLGGGVALIVSAAIVMFALYMKRLIWRPKDS